MRDPGNDVANGSNKRETNILAVLRSEVPFERDTIRLQNSPIFVQTRAKQSLFQEMSGASVETKRENRERRAYEARSLYLRGAHLRPVYTGDFCQGNSTDAIFVAVNLHQVSNMFETPAIWRRQNRSENRTWLTCAIE